MAKKKGPVLDVPCDFGGVSIGDESARIGVSISRGNLEITEADNQLTGRRLTGKIVVRSARNPDQAALPGLEGEDPELTAVFDCKGIRLTGKDIGCGLTFNLNGLDVATLAKFAKRSGQLTITDIQDLPEGSGNGDGHEDEE
jgi:hypothetical protein